MPIPGCAVLSGRLQHGLTVDACPRVASAMRFGRMTCCCYRLCQLLHLHMPQLAQRHIHLVFNTQISRDFDGMVHA